jgi:hypothetical protein
MSPKRVEGFIGGTNPQTREKPRGCEQLQTHKPNQLPLEDFRRLVFWKRETAYPTNNLVSAKPDQQQMYSTS